MALARAQGASAVDSWGTPQHSAQSFADNALLPPAALIPGIPGVPCAPSQG